MQVEPWLRFAARQCLALSCQLPAGLIWFEPVTAVTQTRGRPEKPASRPHRVGMANVADRASQLCRRRRESRMKVHTHHDDREIALSESCHVKDLARQWWRRSTFFLGRCRWRPSEDSGLLVGQEMGPDSINFIASREFLQRAVVYRIRIRLGMTVIEGFLGPAGM